MATIRTGRAGSWIRCRLMPTRTASRCTSTPAGMARRRSSQPKQRRNSFLPLRASSRLSGSSVRFWMAMIPIGRSASWSTSGESGTTWSPRRRSATGKLWQQITMRSAIAAALGLNVFHRQADKLVMCNIAQIVNVLHSMLLTDGDRCIRTPAYYTFELLEPHRGKTAVLVETNDSSPLGLSVSASRQEKRLVLTCINPRHDSGMKVACSLSGAKATSGTGRILHDPDFNACNTFENPDRITPRECAVDVGEAVVRIGSSSDVSRDGYIAVGVRRRAAPTPAASAFGPRTKGHSYGSISCCTAGERIPHR